MLQGPNISKLTERPWFRRRLIPTFVGLVCILVLLGTYRYYTTHFPRIERVLDTRQAETLATWTVTSGGALRLQDGDLSFTEDTTKGEHFIETRPFVKSNRTFVEVTATIEAENLSDLWLRVVSGKSTSALWVQLGQTQRMYRLGARAGSIRLVADRSGWERSGSTFVLQRRLEFELSARFAIADNSDQFVIRLQSFRDGTTIHAGSDQTRWKLKTTSIRILDTGKTVSRLESKSGRLARLFADEP